MYLFWREEINVDSIKTNNCFEEKNCEKNTWKKILLTWSGETEGVPWILRNFNSFAAIVSLSDRASKAEKSKNSGSVSVSVEEFKIVSVEEFRIISAELL